MRGTVVSFDGAKGWGHVEADDGTRYFFHCTAIADGSRQIDEGVDVTFDLVPGHLGRWEATGLSPRPAP